MIALRQLRSSTGSRRTNSSRALNLHSRRGHLMTLDFSRSTVAQRGYKTCRFCRTCSHKTTLIYPRAGTASHRIVDQRSHPSPQHLRVDLNEDVELFVRGQHSSCVQLDGDAGSMPAVQWIGNRTVDGVVDRTARLLVSALATIRRTTRKVMCSRIDCLVGPSTGDARLTTSRRQAALASR
jgi:hypothetical protein